MSSEVAGEQGTQRSCCTAEQHEICGSAEPLNPPAQTNSKTTRDVMGAFVKASLEGINQKAWKTHDKVIKH